VLPDSLVRRQVVAASLSPRGLAVTFSASSQEDLQRVTTGAVVDLHDERITSGRQPAVGGAVRG
jgi:CheY-like chemotaxis protein